MAPEVKPKWFGAKEWELRGEQLTGVLTEWMYFIQVVPWGEGLCRRGNHVSTGIRGWKTPDLEEEWEEGPHGWSVGNGGGEEEFDACPLTMTYGVCFPWPAVSAPPWLLIAALQPQDFCFCISTFHPIMVLCKPSNFRPNRCDVSSARVA